MSPMLTISQFAQAVGVSEGTARRWIARKVVRKLNVRLPHAKRGAVRIPASELERLAAIRDEPVANTSGPRYAAIDHFETENALDMLGL